MYAIKAEGKNIVVKMGEKNQVWDQGVIVNTFPIKDFESANDTKARMEAIAWCKKMLNVDGYLDYDKMIILEAPRGE